MIYIHPFTTFEALGNDKRNSQHHRQGCQVMWNIVPSMIMGTDMLQLGYKVARQSPIYKTGSSV